MSPRSKKADSAVLDAENSMDAESSASASKASTRSASDKVSNDGETPEAPKKRGRPKGSTRKNSKQSTANSDSAEAATSQDSASAKKPSQRGRRKAEDSSDDTSTRDSQTVHPADSESNSEAMTSAQPHSKAAEHEAEAFSQLESRDASSDAEAMAESRDASKDASKADSSANNAEGKGNKAKSNRNNKTSSRRSAPRKPSLNYRDLQSKILPELHLLAKEVDLADYRQMSKDELAIAILERSAEGEGLKLVRGYLEISSDGYGFLQESLLQNNTRSVIVSAGLIKQFKLRTGDFILGKARHPRDNERYGTLIRVEAVNNIDPFQASKRPRFDDLIPTFPEQRIRLETSQNEVASRVIDLLAPIGRGQRGLIVAPPKAGKTTLLKKFAHAVITNEPDIKVIVLLVDERPEEVTDFRESVSGVEVIASTFDEPPTNHIRVAEFVHERARRIVEDGGHVMILLDSITRLARANNLVTPPTGRTLSGGLDSSALHWPKRFLGAARNIRGGGSLSILATALVETGSRMDDVIFEEFKGTGNMELHLSRRLEEKRIFPAIDILKSGTRREDLLLGEAVLAKMWLLRKVISDMDPAEAMDMLLSRLSRSTDNEEFLSSLGQN